MENKDSWVIDDSEEGRHPLLSGCNTVKIRLDGRLKAELDWKGAGEMARRYVEQGLSLFWELDLGLFSQLPMPLSHQTQYLSLGISLDHFRESLWNEFASSSVGVCYYRGSADFFGQFQWDSEHEKNFKSWLMQVFQDVDVFVHETGISTYSFDAISMERCKQNSIGKSLLSLYCRDVAADSLFLLSTHLSAQIPSYLLLDVSQVSSPLLKAQLTAGDRFDAFHLAVKGTSWKANRLYWGEGVISHRESSQQTTIGVCLPPYQMCRPSHYSGLDKALTKLMEYHIPFRVIPESFLVTEWDGLDELIFVPEGLTAHGKRQLQGFCAAGGTVVTLGNPMGFSCEVCLETFLKRMY